MVVGIHEAARAQRAALDPAASVWVAASAGTGKTRVLTDRLLALMLGGTDPARILCLTFTRAAAAEMANRVNAELARWTTLPPGALAQRLVELTGRLPDEHEIGRARQLFARVLDAPGGAKIQTIHAFCQSLLRRFPLEAQVPPEFAVIDERSAAEALEDAVESIIAVARSGGRPDLAEALAVVARHVHEERFVELMTALARERGKLEAALSDGEDALRRRLAALFDIAPEATPDTLTAAFCGADACDLASLRLAAAALSQGSKTDRRSAARIAAWCEAGSGDERALLVEDHLGLFLTQQGDIRARLFTKAAAKAAVADLGDVLGREAERCRRFCDARAAVAIVAATSALARLGQALTAAYDARKRLHAQLDYDDLVLGALALLRRPGIAPWVLFKLDGGLDHVLIDEAQDTNPEQWEIVQILAAEFFAGEDPLGRMRTVFAVGDVKQSIYSFQRADPQSFTRMRRHFQEQVTAAGREWKIVPLEISFRATAPLLQAVDAVFAAPAAADGVSLDGEAVRHQAARAGHAGIVELWPPAPAPVDKPTVEGEAARRVEGRTRLARAIAATIAGWLAAGERLETRGRPIRAGDILILVRRRNAFVDDLLRALKQRGVPVAGTDRLLLTRQLAVKDLVALGHFLILPADDLTLATVLKGPLFGFSEEQLFALAHDRGRETLWGRLRRAESDHPAFAAAADRLSRLLARADFSPPYELYADILGAGGGRRRMLERLGPEAEDPIEEFLALALVYEREHAPSLQGFLHWLVAGETEVKRDLGERERDEVRIMTVHGAKGLEAPIVFLPDTMQLPDPRARLLWTEESALPLWRPHADFNCERYLAEREVLRRRELQEYRRLLYVALTRAQDRLYLCGWETGRAVKSAETWHTLCQAGLRGLATPFAFDAAPLIGARDGWTGEGWRVVGRQEAAPTHDRAAEPAPLSGALPDWLDRPPPPEPDPPRPLFPSQPGGSEPATLSPLAVAGRDRFKRGLLIHRMLQSLPEFPPADRMQAARRFLALPVHALTPDDQEEICRETIAVLETPEFAALWGPDAQAEVPVVGLIPGAEPGTNRALSGQIDRLVVTDERVLIVDYKTLRPPPESEEQVPVVYLQQLATYRGALERVYPDRPIGCAILWTEGPRLMPISPERLAPHLP